MPYPGIDGFLGTRASLMLDVVAVALVALLPSVAVSIYLVRVRRKYLLHKRLQLTLAAVLLVTIVAFETDMRINGWQARAVESPYFHSPSGVSPLMLVLWIHLSFAITTPILWAVVVVQALRHFPRYPAPTRHSRAHKFLGWTAAIDMVGTAVTGWIFYWMAFVAG